MNQELQMLCPPELLKGEEWDNNNDLLSADQRAQLYLELYKQQMSYFHETRRLEFQANLALWGAIFAVGYALAGKVHPSPSLSFGFIIFTCVLSGVWASFLKKTKGFDKHLFGQYRSRIERLLGANPLNPSQPVRFVSEHAWWLFYVLATFFFSAGVVAFLHAIPLTKG